MKHLFVGDIRTASAYDLCFICRLTNEILRGMFGQHTLLLWRLFSQWGGMKPKTHLFASKHV